MALVNEYFLRLTESYLFSDIAKKVNAFKLTHPKERVISLGIGSPDMPPSPETIDILCKEKR